MLLTALALRGGSWEIRQNAYLDVIINIDLVSVAKMSENRYLLSKSRAYLVVVPGRSADGIAAWEI